MSKKLFVGSKIKNRPDVKGDLLHGVVKKKKSPKIM